MTRHKRLRENPLDFLKVKKEVEKTHPRRALTPDEQARLLEATRVRGPFRGLDGLARSLLYRTAMQTGLRARELASVTVADLDLDGAGPVLTLDGSRTKNRKQARLPLSPALARALGEWLAGRPRDAMLWPGNWARYKEAGVMLRADLEVAGIPYEVGGRFADFHALRMTFVTNLARTGAPPKVAQVLARHSDINLTMGVYTDVDGDDLRRAIERTDPLVTSPARTGINSSNHQDPPREFAPEFAPSGVPGWPEVSGDGQTTRPGVGPGAMAPERCNPLFEQEMIAGCPELTSDVSGGGGIRTHGTGNRYTGFRDRPFQPLRHPSGDDSDRGSVAPGRNLRARGRSPWLARPSLAGLDG